MTSTPTDDRDYLILDRALVVFSEPRLLDVAGPGAIGYVVVQPPAPGDRFGDFAACHVPGLSVAQVAAFREFAVLRLYSFMKNGPLPELWQKRTIDNGWQAWLSCRYLDVTIPDVVPHDWSL